MHITTEMSEAPRSEPHAISDSEPEVVVTKKKKYPRKQKMATPTAEGASTAGITQPTPVHTPLLVSLPVTQATDELAEIRSLVKEMKSLNQRNTAFAELFAQTEQGRQPVETAAQLQAVGVGENHTDRPNLDDVSHEQVVMADQLPVALDLNDIPAFGDPHDYGWETDEETEQGDETTEGHLTLLQKILSKGSVAPAMAAVVNATPAAATSEGRVLATGAVDLATRQVFRLSDELREGTLQNELQELYKKMKKPVSDRIQLDESLAGAIAHFYAYTKPKKALNDIARQYTGIKTVPEARVQALNDEIKFADGRKLAEEGMMWATKGVVAALTAIAPTLALVLSRGKGDRELDEQAKPMFDAMKVLVHTHTQLTADRLANVYKVVNTPLGKEVIKKKADKYGEKELPTEHLLGENLGDKNKKVIRSARAADTVMNTSLAPKKWRKSGDYYRGTTVNRRARGYRGGRGGHQRAGPYNAWNSRSENQPARYTRSADFGGVSNYQSTQRGARGRGGSNANRGFQK